MSKQLAEAKADICKLKASKLVPQRMARAKASNIENGRWGEAM